MVVSNVCYITDFPYTLARIKVHPKLTLHQSQVNSKSLYYMFFEFKFKNNLHILFSRSVLISILASKFHNTLLLLIRLYFWLLYPKINKGTAHLLGFIMLLANAKLRDLHFQSHKKNTAVSDY